MNVPEKHRAVAHAWVDGAEVEYKTCLSVIWHETNNPDWFEQHEYRIRLTKPSINWSHVHPKYTHMAMDSDGRTWLHPKEPISTLVEWVVLDSSDVCVVKVDGFASFKAGTCDWKDSLVARPQGE